NYFLEFADQFASKPDQRPSVQQNANLLLHRYTNHLECYEGIKFPEQPPDSQKVYWQMKNNLPHTGRKSIPLHFHRYQTDPMGLAFLFPLHEFFPRCYLYTMQIHLI